MPISKIDFPAITICSQGTINEVRFQPSMKGITPRILSLCFIQVRDNVMQDQFNEYIKSKGKEPDEITAEEKAELEAKMAGDLFPG